MILILYVLPLSMKPSLYPTYFRNGEIYDVPVWNVYCSNVHVWYLNLLPILLYTYVRIRR